MDTQKRKKIAMTHPAPGILPWLRIGAVYSFGFAIRIASISQQVLQQICELSLLSWTSGWHGLHVPIHCLQITCFFKLLSLCPVIAFALCCIAARPFGFATCVQGYKTTK